MSQEARRYFVVEIDAILSEMLVICDVTTEAGAANEARLRTLRRYVLDKFDHQVGPILQEPDFGLLTRRLIQRVVAEWPHYASNALNDDIEAQLREAWNASHHSSPSSRRI